MKPTPRAQALWPDVRAALVRLRAALAPGGFNPTTDAANFRIAMPDAIAASVMPHIVEQLQRATQADLRVLPLTTHDPGPMLERGEADLAIGHFPGAIATLHTLAGDTALRHERLQESGYLCVMRQGHPLTQADLTLDAYCAAHHLRVSLSGRAQGLVDQALRQLDRKRCVLLTVNQYFTAGRVVANSDLLTVLPAVFVNAIGFPEKVVTRPVPFELPRLHLDMLWHQRYEDSSSQRWLRAALRDAWLAARA